MTAVDSTRPTPWLVALIREPTKEQWLAWWAAWLGWTLDAFDFTVFLLIMVPISKEFNVPLSEVTLVFTITLWLRLLGATGSGWLADRIGRKAPLMISIAGYSLCNFVAGFSPTFMFLFAFRALLGIFMGAEWPAGASLAMEQWPTRTRGFMSGALQGSWNLGFLLSSLAYGLLYDTIGWRGLLMMGILPAFALVYIRYFVKEPPVWLENRKQQRLQQREVRAPLLNIFKRGIRGNTATACWWMASAFIVYYSINALFATYLQKDLHLNPGLVALPIALSNGLAFLGSCFWGLFADHIGRRWAMIIPGALTVAVAPVYLWTGDYTWIVAGFALQGLFGGSIYGQQPSYLCERFPTEVRSTASGFCYHQGAIWGGFVPWILALITTNTGASLAIAMMIGTMVGATSFVIALLNSPETKGTEMVPDLVVA